MTTPRTITLAYLHCLKCGHTWLPRSASRPSQCPAKHCHNASWDKPYVNKRKDNKEQEKSA